MRPGSPRCETLGLLRTRRDGVPGNLVEVDLTDHARMETIVREFRPEAIIHAGAITAPAECEKNPDLATRVNFDATRRLAVLAAEADARFVFVSTDIVFDGQKGRYREGDPVSPLSHYAQTKVWAEQAIPKLAPNHMIVRTSLMVGTSPLRNRSANEAMARALERGETLKLFVDEFRCIVSAANLAEALLEVAGRTETGLLHFVGPERKSRYEWGLQIAQHFGWDVSRIQSVRRDELKLTPPRPPDCSLDISKARAMLKTRFQTVAEALREMQP